MSAARFERAGMTPQQVLAVVMAHAGSGHPAPSEEFWQSLEDTPIDKLTPEHLEVIQQAGLIHLLSEMLQRRKPRPSSES